MSSTDKTSHIITEGTTAESRGNSTAVSFVLFLVLFGLFAGGLYVLSLFTPVTFIVGLSMSILALYLAFDLVPRLLR